MHRIFCPLHCLIPSTQHSNLILLFFYFLLFLAIFPSSVDNQNVRLRLALAIPTGVPIAAVNDAIEILPLFADKTIKKLSK